MYTAAVIGRGKIGSGIIKELSKINFKVKFSLDRDSVYVGNKKIDEATKYKKYTKGLSCAFLTIPTLDDGKIAAGFIEFFAKKKIPVVTCEKGSLSNYSFRLKPYLNRIGYNATVGGGTRMLDYVRARDHKKVTEILAIVNGTLNFIFSSINDGKTLDKAVREAIKLGYTEPGAKDPLDVINAELKDVLLKSVILFNASGITPRILVAKKVHLQKINKNDLSKILRDVSMRCVVTISTTRAQSIGGFHAKIGRWHLTAGFLSIGGSWLPKGVNNGLLIREGGNEYLLQGPGAGVVPTVSSMLQDASELLALE